MGGVGAETGGVATGDEGACCTTFRPVFFFTFRKGTLGKSGKSSFPSMEQGMKLLELIRKK